MWSLALSFPVLHQGNNLGEGVHKCYDKEATQQAPQTPGFYSRLLVVQKDSQVLATHHRPIHPEHIHRLTTLPYGDSLVHPTLHSPRRLEDLSGSSGRLPSGSNPHGITSGSSVHYGRSLIPVQGTMRRANYCPSGLYKAHGSMPAIPRRHGIRVLRYLYD